MSSRCSLPWSRSLVVSAISAAALLSACGGGGGGTTTTDPTDAASCTLASQQTWLKAYRDDNYFWYSLSPSPHPTTFSTIDDYFYGLLFTNTTAEFPVPDRWSYTQSSADFNSFFTDGQTLGWGVSVAGIEVDGSPGQPLRVRAIAPGSPADGRIARGDTIVSVNGVPSATLIASGDYSSLTPSQTGQTLTLVLSGGGGGGSRTVTLTSATYALVPVPTTTTLTTPRGTSVGYVQLSQFISQASAPLDAAFAGFKAAGIHEVVLDLRYNGGGLVSVADELASYAIGSAQISQTFATLTYNDRHQAQNTTVAFGTKAAALGLSRIYVLTGPRTCSASELVINGLKPFVEVVQIGGTTCGKPVGFVPVQHCDTTFSAVNFESRNANGVGRYWDGITPACAVADDLNHAPGTAAEGLTAEALQHVDTGGCSSSATAPGERPQGLRSRLRAGTGRDGPEVSGMILR